MTAYYNEIDPYAAQWLRNLIDGGHIARGDVDERSIVDVRADDLRGYSQAHFFAGIGGWSIALRLAGWPDDRPVWTGSCPCQPFSAAGKGEAFNDERHLWPAWLPLIAERRPPIVFGEQVEAAVGWGWLDTVFADLEQEGYAVGAAVLPACGVGAPHIRQRLWFVADAYGGNQHAQREGEVRPSDAGATPRRMQFRPGGHSTDGLMADADGRHASAEGLQRSGQHGQQPQDGRSGRMADAMRTASEWRAGSLPRTQAPQRGAREFDGRGPDGLADGGKARDMASFWSACDWLPCTDGKARPVAPGSFPLGHGIRNRTHQLRAYGNAIVPQVAAEFIRACEP